MEKANKAYPLAMSVLVCYVTFTCEISIFREFSNLISIQIGRLECLVVDTCLGGP